MTLLLALWADPAQAGAWTRDLGSYYAKVGVDAYRADQYWNPLTQRIEPYSYAGTQVGVYGEVGISKDWPVQLSGRIPVTTGVVRFVPEGLIDLGEAKAVSTRVGDIDVSVQTALWKRATPLAVAFSMKIPTWEDEWIGKEWPVYADNFPRPGDGQIDMTGWVLFGASIPHTKLWTDLAVGYRHRTEWYLRWQPRDYVDGIPFAGTLGGTFGRVIPMVRVDGIGSLKADESTRSGASVSPAVLVDVWRSLAVEARGSVDVWSRNAARGYGFGIGVSSRTH